jgi:hypothetical protein
MKDYYEKLPRKVKGKGKCLVLNADGDSCNKKAKYEVYYHLDSGLYDYALGTWVRCYVCDDHIQEQDARDLGKP